MDGYDGWMDMMDGWIVDGWMDGWMDGWRMDRWMDEMDGWIDDRLIYLRFLFKAKCILLYPDACSTLQFRQIPQHLNGSGQAWWTGCAGSFHWGESRPQTTATDVVQWLRLRVDAGKFAGFIPARTEQGAIHTRPLTLEFRVIVPVISSCNKCLKVTSTHFPA